MTGEIKRTVAHRPWPLPAWPWVMFQSWRDVLFAHWRVPFERLRPLVPGSLVVEEFDGSGWVGLVPFRIVDLHPRLVPPLPGLSDFPEMNLRTYVRVGDKPGVYFFSLDAASTAAVLAARVGYRLPYFRADMKVASLDGWVEYRSRRRCGQAEFIGRYAPLGEARTAEPGTLEHFLVERYALYAPAAGGLVLRGDIHHRPWPLQPAQAVIDVNSVLSAHGIVPAPGTIPCAERTEFTSMMA